MGRRFKYLKKVLVVFLGIMLAATVCFSSITYNGICNKAALKELKSITNLQEQEETIETPSNLYAQAAVMIDGDTGRVLYDKNGSDVLPMASTTKIMTCILALENGNPEDVVTVSDYAATMPDVSLGLIAGDTYYLNDLLYSMMLASHNDTAVAVAEHIGGSVEQFATMMNNKAKEIGCTHTFFVTPNGLDGEAYDEQGELKQHSTTATDLAKILKYCMKQSKENQKFIEITTAASWSFGNLPGTKNHTVTNHNSFLTMRQGASSGKTGFTAKAGYCYVGSVVLEDRTLIVALLACGWPNNKTYKWTDMKKLVDYGVAAYSFRNVYEEMILSPIPVKDAIGEIDQFNQLQYVDVKVDYGEEIPSINMLLRQDEKVDISVEIAEQLCAPVLEKQLVGMVTYRLNGAKIKEYPIITCQGFERINLSWCLQEILKRVAGF